MPPSPHPLTAPQAAPARRWLLWSVLVSLLVVGQSLLVVLTLRYEEARAQERVDEVANGVAADIKRAALQRQQALQLLLWNRAPQADWRADAADLLRRDTDVLRLERRDAQLALKEALDRPSGSNPPPMSSQPNAGQEWVSACLAAQQTLSPQYSRSYFMPLGGGSGLEVVRLCEPEQREGLITGYTIATISLSAWLESASAGHTSGYELSLEEPDGARLARTGAARGRGIFVARRTVDLVGTSLQLKVDDTLGRPGLIPNLTTALVLSLSIALALVVALLLRDMRRRTRVENALAEALAFRKAMEDSLITGLRARDLQGRITYVNPAFCAMVGWPVEALLDSAHADPPYWPPERRQEYQQRQAARRRMGQLPASSASASATPFPDSQLGFETMFMRANGERFPVMIYEAPLVDGQGQHTGWMSAVLDVSEQRRVEDLSRQQQDRLQATARLATMGEMASLLSHELNQPLAAIASYASASQNLLQNPDEQTLPMLRQAVQRMAEQADRAGRVIKSVHDFVRRREQAQEAIRASDLIEGVLPLVRLQARKSGTRIEVLIDDPSARVMVDRTMMEQVLLNLTRNGIQAMERDTPLHERVLTLRVLPDNSTQQPQRVVFEVWDEGAGISEDVAAQLFTPFYTTRAEGMGLGLSLCRTVIEQHGGTLEHGPGRRHEHPSERAGCCFRFSVAAAA